jgi:recombination protein RecT
MENNQNNINNTNGAVLAKKPIDILKNTLKASSVQEQFQNALKENSGVFIASIIDLYNNDQYLQQCDPNKVVMESLKAAILKLPINKSLGFAYLVPFKQNGVQQPQFQIGYKGLIQLAMRTGQYRIINADKVHEGEFKLKNKLTGEFDMTGEKKSETVVGYFAHIEMLNGFAKTLYMTKPEIEAHAKKYSKSYNSNYSPWKTEFDAMATKTVLRNLLSHYGFLSVEMANGISHDIEGDTLQQEVHDRIHNNANKQSFSMEEAEVINDNDMQEEVKETCEENPI